MKINDTFATISGSASVLDSAVTSEGTIRVSFRYPEDLPTDEPGVRTFTEDQARSVGLIH